MSLKTIWWKVFLGLAVLILAAAGAVVLLLQTRTAEEWMRRQIVFLVQQQFPVEMNLKGFHLDLWGLNLQLMGLEIENQKYPVPQPAIEIDRVDVNLSILGGISPDLSLDSLRLENPRVRLRKDPNDKLNLVNMFSREKPDEKKEKKDGLLAPFTGLAIHRLELSSGLISYKNHSFSFDSAKGGFVLQLGFSSEVQGYQGTLKLEELSLDIKQVSLPPISVTGTIGIGENQLDISDLSLRAAGLEAAVDGKFSNLRDIAYELEIEADFDLAEWGKPDFLSEFTEGELQLQGRLRGEGSQVEFEGQARSQTIKIERFPVTDLTVALTVDNDQLRVDKATFRFSQGRSEAAGLISWSSERTSRFNIKSRSINVKKILQEMQWDGFMKTAAADVDGEISWPGLDFGDLRGRAEVDYQGEFREGRLSYFEPSPLPFEGRVETNFTAAVFQLERGFLESKESSVSYRGQVDTSGRFEFDVDAESNELEELLKISLTERILPDNWNWSEYPLQPDGPFRASLNFGDLDGPFQLQGKTSLEALSLRNVPLGRATTSLELEEQELRLEDLTLASDERILLAADLMVPLTDRDPETTVQFSAELRDLPLRFLAPLVAAGSFPAEGLLSGNFSMRGGKSDYRGDGRFQLSDLRLFDEPTARRVEGDVTLAGTRINIMNLSGQILEGSITGRIAYDWQQNSYNLLIEGTDLLLDRFPFSRLSLAELDSLKGRCDVRISGLGNVDRPDLDFRLEAPALHFGGFSVSEVSLEASIASQKLPFHLTGEMTGHPLSLEGEVEVARPFPFSVNLEFAQFPVGLLTDLADFDLPENFDGHVSGSAAADGTFSELAETQASARLNDLDLIFGKQRLAASRPLELEYQKGVVRVQEATLSGNGTDFQLEGEVALLPEVNLDLEVNGSISLEIISTLLEDTSVSGEVQLRADIVGPLREPRVVGSADLEEVVLAHPDLPTTIRRGRGSIQFTANQASIKEMRAQTDFGEVMLEGGIFFSGLEIERWQMNLVGEGLRLDYPEDVRSTVNVNLNLVKSGSNQLIHGIVNVRSAEYTEDISIPDLVRRASRNGSGGASRRSKEGIALDIKIRANRSIRLTNNLGDVLASSELTLSGTLEDPVLLGDLVIEEGELYFAGNDYEITRGNLVFNDPTQTIPYLNFEATTEVREYVIDVSLQGPADNFNFSFRSDPPLSTASVVSLLAAGQTQEEIFGSEATGQTSSSTLAIYGTGALAGRTLETFLQPETSRLLGLERFAIDPFVDSSRGRDPGARITIGKQVNADLSITLITSLSADLTGQTLIFQYELTDWLTAVGTRQEDGSVAVDFKLRKRF